MPNSAPLTSPATPSMVTGTTRSRPAPDGPSDLVFYGRVLTPTSQSSTLCRTLRSGNQAPDRAAPVCAVHRRSTGTTVHSRTRSAFTYFFSGTVVHSLHMSRHTFSQSLWL